MRLVIETEPGVNESLRSCFNESDYLDPVYDEFIIGVTSKSIMVYDYDSLVNFILCERTPGNFTFEEYKETDEGRDTYHRIKNEIFWHVLSNNIDVLLLDVLF